jgi:DNA-binding NarL/FixJ family response regulator
MKAKLIIVDDHRIFAQGLKKIFDDCDDIECIAVAYTGESGYELAKRLKPNVVILDISLPDISGIEVARKIKNTCKACEILILTAYDDYSLLQNALSTGVGGYLLKTADRDEIVSAVRTAYLGSRVYTKEIADAIFSAHFRHHASKSGEVTPSLHPRQLEILKLVAKGCSNKEIALSLSISEHTVASHIANILRNLGLSTRGQAIVYALKKGWFSISEL